MAHLTHDSYGKSGIRLTKVTRHADRHDLRELTVDIELEGDFAASYTDGDNASLVATDTMKNTVYALARSHPMESPEAFGLALAAHFVDGNAHVASATVHLAEQAWARIPVDGAPHPTAFVAGSREQRVCTVLHAREGTEVVAGLEDLLVLKTTDSAFTGFLRDAYTTLPDTDDRILATSVTAYWTYAGGEHDWNACFDAVRTAMLDVFARHHSLAVQQTLHLMGTAALDACPAVTEITLQLPNSHRLLVNLSPFGLDNPNVVFVTDEPFGLISGTLTRE